MIKIPVNKDYNGWAKSMITEFDKQKTYNKFKCKNNWLGLLGELYFHRWLNKQGIEHNWIDFYKQSWDEPDFVIYDGTKNKVPIVTIDVKTTFDFKMWIQKPVVDIYVFLRMNRTEQDKIIMVGWLEGKRIQKLIDNNKLEIVERAGRRDFLIPVNYIRPIESLSSKLKMEVDKYARRKKSKPKDFEVVRPHSTGRATNTFGVQTR